MEYNYNDINLTNQDINVYLDQSINKVFALLGIYEDCIKYNNFDNYFIYLNRLITEFNGIYYLFGVNTFLSLISILKGMSTEKNIDHKNVKSLTFHCISILKKMKVI